MSIGNILLVLRWKLFVEAQAKVDHFEVFIEFQAQILSAKGFLNAFSFYNAFELYIESSTTFNSKIALNSSQFQNQSKTIVQ